ncbi:hypothetical protein Scani_20620 [Streptomyces caniferus]|uniref:Uncharacterized protein n=1 Tax=Streptomyces caniferus TaxID=285557 RepID=A0A640S4R8_9ACTN|nr:hypothetical protein Scani_20620 [Streptomyces caniferus]
MSRIYRYLPLKVLLTATTGTQVRPGSPGRPVRRSGRPRDPGLISGLVRRGADAACAVPLAIGRPAGAPRPMHRR